MRLLYIPDLNDIVPNRGQYRRATELREDAAGPIGGLPSSSEQREYLPYAKLLLALGTF